MGKLFPLPPRLVWGFWLAAAVLWTAGLVMPDPHQITGEALSPEAFFTIGKSLHVLAYAFLTFLGLQLGLRGRLRWLPVIFMSLHAFGTEAVQYAFPELHRTGSLRDVAIDHVGILLGLAAAGLVWLIRRRLTPSCGPRPGPS
jgi:hypothetical protein